MSSSPQPQVSLKLVIDKKHKKILFGEADKNFIDFLFTILALPVGTILNLISNEAEVGSLGNIYSSVDKLNSNYFLPNQKKEKLLNPKVTIPQSQAGNLLKIEYPSVSSVYYICSYSSCHTRGHNVSSRPTAKCSSCRSSMNHKISYVYASDETKKEISTGEEEPGYVKGMVTYMVMDDLTVKPMSAMSYYSMINQFNVGFVEEKLFYLDMKEGVNLLRASLHSTRALSDVFLHQIDFENMTISEEVAKNEITD